MAKITLSDVSNILGNPTSAANTINANNDLIEAALENTLSRNGASPNQMLTDLDLDNNDLLNVGIIDADKFVLAGRTLVPEDVATLPETVMIKPDYDPHLVYTVSTVTELKTIEVTRFTSLYLKEAGREGIFKWTLGDFSALVAADTQEGVYIKADAIAATNGAWVRVYDGILRVEWFGASPYTDEELIALNGDPSIDVRAAANSTAVAATDALAVFLGGAKYTWGAGIYVLDTRYTRGPSVYSIGVSAGRFQPKSVADKRWDEGTILLFKGTGAKEVTFPGITSMEHGGGWRPDPDNPGQYIKLWSAYNPDATGTQPATLRQFSVAVLEDNRQGFGGIKDLRIAVWKGTDGISDYSNASAGLWGDDWDFGHVILNTEQCDTERLQVIGPWREAGHAMMITTAANNRCERNQIKSSWFQGRIGHLVRAPDMWAVTGLAPNSVSIRWSSEIYFDPAGGSFRGSDNVTYTYAGVSHTGSDPTYTFTGVFPDPQAAGIFHIRHASSGLANSEYHDTYAFGLDHPSGNKAEFYGTTSKAREISGNPLRGLKFRNSKGHTSEKVIEHYHICADLTQIDHQFEGGGFVIASPSTVDQAAYAAAPVFETRNLVSLASTGLSDSADTRLLTPRSGFIPELQLAPRNDLTGDLVMTALRSDKHTALQSKSSGEVQFRNSSGTVGFRWTDAGALSLEGGGQFTLTGGVGRINFQTGQSFTLREGTTTALQVDPTTRTVRPGADGTQRLGRSDTRWSEVHSNLLCVTDGVTAPAAIPGMAVIYVDTADGDLKIKFGDGTIKTIVVDV